MKKWMVIFLVLFCLLAFVLVVLKFNLLPLPSYSVKQSSPKPGDLSLVSDIATVSASFSNQSWLEERLESLNFWQEAGVTLYEPSGLQRRRINVKSLVIHLTDKPQPLGQTVSILPDGGNYLYQSFGMNYDYATSSLNLLLFIHPEIIRSEAENELGTRLSGLTLSTVFDLTHPLLPQHKDFQERLTGKDVFMEELKQIGGTSFITVKR